jgi:docosahexaenoic acid omega-hydroxylase
MANTILLLAMHPKIQDKLVAELKEVLTDQDADITMEQLTQLVYLKQVINEAMRMLDIVPFYSRVLTGEVELSE